ncbi:MAG: STAS domain-containing protein [Firmicutes bacterium]|nr:STAS domain-containing protein [Bacillota bacterium]
MALRLNTNYNENAKSWEIELIGEVDINSKALLKDELIQLNEKKQSDFVFKCENLEYIDSTGLGVLISFYKNVKLNNKTVHFEKLKPSILKIFTLTGLDRIFSIRN